MTRLVAPALFAVALICPSVASGQTAFSRVWLDVDFGVSIPAEKDFTVTFSPILFEETATFTTVYSMKTGATFGVGGGFMFNRKLGFGVAYSGASSEDFATLTARVPHPAVFNAYGSDEAPTNQTLRHSETDIHLQVMFVAMDTGKLRIRVFGGPSYIKVTQAMIESFSYTQTFTTNPTTNTVTITGHANPVDYDDSSWGFHVGGDVSYFFTKILGAGGFVRYTGGSVDLDNPLPAGGTVEVKAGGLQLGGGLRLRF